MWLFLGGTFLGFAIGAFFMALLASDSLQDARIPWENEN